MKQMLLGLVCGVVMAAGSVCAALPQGVAPTGATCTWEGTGGGDTNDWFDAANWRDGVAPGPGDAVVVDAAKARIVISNTTPLLASFTIGADNSANTAVLVFTNWSTALAADEVTVGAYGTLTCAGPFTNAPAMSNRVWIVCSNLTVAASGQINADYKGYAPSTSSTQRASGPRGGYGGSGGAHGGFGGIGYGDLGDEVYPCGDPVHPELPGSGGGAEATTGAKGGAGGGAVRIEASGHVLVDGIVAANGQTRFYNQAGGGAGGSIWISCRTIGGSGALRANGGTHQAWGAPGSGGRIAIHYDPPAQSNAPAANLTFSVLPGGTLDAAYGTGTGILFPDIGTVYFPDAGLLREPINVSGQVHLGQQNEWTTDNLTINGNWIRFPQEGFRCTVAGNVLIQKVGSVAGRLDLGASCLTNFGVGTTGGPWNGYRLFGAGAPSQLIIGGNLTLTNSGQLFVHSSPTNGVTPPDYGALVEVGGEMRLESGCWVIPFSHWSNGASPLFRVQTLSVSSNAGFNADYAGFAGGGLAGASKGYYGWGPGRGWRPTYTHETAGGSYGGLGGRALADKIYGSSNAPALPGSGGMGGVAGGQLGGFGGGLIQIEARHMKIDGTLTAGGGNNAASWDAGGSGGGIYLTCHTFRGGPTTLLRANAGAGYFKESGGGGGRIAVWRMRDYSPGAVSNAVAGSGLGQPGTAVWGTLPAPGTLLLLR